MLRFNLFGFPITIHWMFWLAALLLGGAGATGSGNPLPFLISWTAALFISILWHELGHAFFQRKYGGRPEIMIHGMGGYSSSVGRFSKSQDITISFMGPFFNLLILALCFLLILKIPKPSPYLAVFLGDLIFINQWLLILNLLPVLPLDGGRIVSRFLGSENQRTTVLIGMVTAGIVALVCQFHFGQVFIAIFFGYLAYQNFQSYKKGYGSPNLPF